MTPGELNYTTYGFKRNWVAFNGDPIPTWTDVDEGIKEAWEMGARAVKLQALEEINSFIKIFMANPAFQERDMYSLINIKEKVNKVLYGNL